MLNQTGTIDMMRAGRRPAAVPNEFYQHPHTYAVTVGTTRVQLAAGRLPVATLLVQASLANGGIVCIGDSAATTSSGIELDAGKSALFLPDFDSTFFMQMLLLYQPSSAVRYPELLRPANRSRVLIDVSDYWAVATVASQTVRVFWSPPVEIP